MRQIIIQQLKYMNQGYKCQHELTLKTEHKLGEHSCVCVLLGPPEKQNYQDINNISNKFTMGIGP